MRVNTGRMCVLASATLLEPVSTRTHRRSVMTAKAFYDDASLQGVATQCFFLVCPCEWDAEDVARSLRTIPSVERGEVSTDVKFYRGETVVVAEDRLSVRDVLNMTRGMQPKYENLSEKKVPRYVYIIGRTRPYNAWATIQRMTVHHVKYDGDADMATPEDIAKAIMSVCKLS